MFGAKRHPNRKWLKGASLDVWRRLSDHILGEEIHGLEVKDESGNVIKTPKWVQSVAYEVEVRRKAYASVRAGEGSLAHCLEEAWGDGNLRSRPSRRPRTRGQR